MGTIIQDNGQDEEPPAIKEARQKKRRTTIKKSTKGKSKTATDIAMQRVMRYRKQTKKQAKLREEERKRNARTVIVVGGRRGRTRRMRNKGTRDMNDDSSVDWVKFNASIANKGQEEKTEYFKNRMKNVSGKVVYGKFWMNGCGFCNDIQPTWKGVVNNFRQDHTYVNVDIINENAAAGVEALRQTTGVTVSADGYPTLYKIKNNRVDYYSGDRSYPSIVSWLSTK
jgi:hypothetical protein